MALTAPLVAGVKVMVLIDGDPLKDITDTRRIDLVFKGGKRYVPKALEQAIGIAPALN